MDFIAKLSNLLQDPPPRYVYEFSEAGIAFARGGETGWAPFEAGTLIASPVEDNLRRPDVVAAALARTLPETSAKKGQPNKPRRAALILPDYAARVSVLDFDSFPASHEEQLALVRFRLKKSLPFDVDSAAVSFYAQPSVADNKDGKQEVVAAAVALEIIARYEALFRAANFHAGEVTTSGLACLHLFQSPLLSVIAKLAGRVLTVMVVQNGILKLFRCVEMESAGEEEIQMVLYPTLAYIEDELGARADQVILFPGGLLSGLQMRTDELRSRYGTPSAHNAGMYGYLEGAAN